MGGWKHLCCGCCRAKHGGVQYENRGGGAEFRGGEGGGACAAAPSHSRTHNWSGIGEPSACVTFFIYTLQAAAGADVVMLDNYTPAALAIDAAALKVLFPHVLVEASGVSRSFI